MSNPESTVWLHSVTSRKEGYEWEAVERFSERLLKLARARMPVYLRSRVDAEDVVQSVFKSFFYRNGAGQFRFDESLDIWRLLAAITYRKVQRATRYHLQQQRDVRREVGEAADIPGAEQYTPTAASVIMMAESLESILSKLPATHRQVLQLRLDGHSIPEISSQLGLSTRTVDRGLALARKIAEEEADDEPA